VHVRGNDDAVAGAGLDVDVGVDAALADQAQVRQALEQFRVDPSAFADKHQRFGVAQPGGQFVDVLGVVGPHLHPVPVESAEASQGAQGVEPVVEDRHVHGRAPVLVRSDPAWSEASSPKSRSSVHSPLIHVCARRCPS
jgi:hypothetical protein